MPEPWTTWSMTLCGDCGTNGDAVLGRPPWFGMWQESFTSLG